MRTVAVAAVAVLLLGGVARAQQPTVVEIVGFSYDPQEVTIAPGTAVRWINRDNVPHTATSDVGAFDSGTLDTGGTFEFTFTEAGRFVYHCEIHAEMRGVVVVRSP